MHNTRHEWNFGGGCPDRVCPESSAASAFVAEHWPASVPLVFSGYELGSRVHTGTRLLTGEDCPAKLWSVRSGECACTLQGHSRAVNSATFSQDDAKVITASSDCSAKIWSSMSGACLRTLGGVQGHKAPLHCATLSPDGSLALTAAADDDVKLWAVDSGNCIRALEILIWTSRALGSATIVHRVVV